MRVSLQFQTNEGTLVTMTTEVREMECDKIPQIVLVA